MKLERALALVFALAFGAHAETYFWNRNPALSGAGGMGKAYNWSRTESGIGGRPVSNTDDQFDAGIDTAKVWKFLDQDGVDSTGKVVAAGGKVILSGQGRDFTQEKHFFTAIKRSDNKGIFDVTVRVDSQFDAHAWSKAGIMMADDFNDFSKGGVALVAITPKNGAIFEYNLNLPAGNIDHTDKMEGVTLPLPIWLRLVKGSTTVSAYYRLDSGSVWIPIGVPQATLDMGADSEVGLFVVGVEDINTGLMKTTAAAFDDFRGGGEIANPGLDLRFDGVGPNADADVVLADDFAAHSLDFTGYTGKLGFNSYTMSLSGNLKLVSGMESINPGTGSLVFTGTTQDTLWPRLGDTLPAIRKAGPGNLALMGATEAVSLKIEAGTLDLNNYGLALTGFSATGGTLQGLGADDILAVAGNADFAGLASLALPAGQVIIKAVGNGGSAVLFNPGGKTFPKLTLHTSATGPNDATLIVGPGALTAAGGLLLQNQGAVLGNDGVVDFRTHDPAVTVGDDLTQIKIGTGDNLQKLFMGDGYWTCAGNVSISLKDGSADKSTLRLSATSGTQSLLAAQGALFKVEHDNGSTLKLAGGLSAADFTQSAGALDFNGQNIALTGNLAITKGGPNSLLNLGGRKLTVEGNASFAGTSAGNLGLNPSVAWILEVTKSLTADSADIGNSDAGPRAAGTASKGCNDKGANKNWTFWQPPVPPSIIREPADVLAKPKWTVKFSLAIQGTAPFTYAWHKLGDTAVRSIDTALVLDSVQDSLNGSGWFAVVTNAFGKDTSRVAYLTVRACDSTFAPPAALTVKEGGKVVLGARAGCASEVGWSPVSGPVPKLFDPQVDTLTFTAPRVQGDSTLVLQFSARYGANVESADVTVKVVDTIPDPVVQLASQPAWSGAAPKVVRAGLKNAAEMAAFPGYPIRYLWNVVPFVADTASSGDSLVLAEPGENGNLDITVCADNGGTPSCATLVLAVERPVVSLRGALRGTGPLAREGRGFRWHAPGLVRIMDWRGRVLWQAWGSTGSFAEPSPGAASALRSRAARLEFMAARR